VNTERWQRIRDVLDHAIALSAEERSEFVENACAGDDELQVEVQSLLHSHEQAGEGFLNDPVIDLRSLVPEAYATSYIGRRIGVYKILEEIGRGGMGEVYRASRVDGQYDKQVAIKLVRVGPGAPTLLERFYTERQILASLDHPNIARLHDGGTTEDGVPYLAMELIEGVPVDRYCEGHDLGLTERLRLFTQICAAVQYAHQRLVIHRDIKPSNILVTEDAVPKLLDFGIAKILDPSHGGRVTTMYRAMTPEFASPEQIRGEPITTATDIYSLGVVLYRLLTGRSPYSENTRTPHELAQLICDTEVKRPSTVVLQRTEAPATGDGKRGHATDLEKLNKKLKGDLDNIVLKALRKQTERRYASAEQLSEDIQRHLAGRPVKATPDSLAYRADKFVRRHKVVVLGTALIVFVVAGGIASTVREARIASENARRAERRFADVRKLADSFLFEFDDAIEYLPGSTPARSLVVKRALEYLTGLAAEAGGDRSLQMEIATAYKKVGKVQGDPIFPNLGDSKGALESFKKALAILESIAREEPANDEVRLELASTHQQISDVLNFSGDTTGAVEHSRTALTTYEALAPKLTGDAKFQRAQTTETYHYANLLQSAGALDEAAAEYKQAVELSRQIVAASPSDPEGKVHLAASLDGLGYVLQQNGDSEGALENLHAALLIREELTRVDPNNSHYLRQLAFSHQNVGLSLSAAGDLPAALAHFHQELTLFDSLSAADPKDAQARRNRSLAHKMIGDVSLRSGDHRHALAEYQTALSIDRELAAIDPNSFQANLDLSVSESKTGSALGKRGRSAEAFTIMRDGIARQESLLAKDSNRASLYSSLANSYTSLANLLNESGNREASLEYFQKAVDARLKLSEKIPSTTNQIALAECYSNLAKVFGTSSPAEAMKQSNNAVVLLTAMAEGDRKNTQYRIALANARLTSARLYVRIAEHELGTRARIQDWTKAAAYYQDCRRSLLQLDEAGKPWLAQRSLIQAIDGELAYCNRSMAELRQVR
jgi:serine/threonine protein kinase